MTELRRSMNALVERPPAKPPAIEVVAARSEDFARRRRLLRGAAGLALVVVASAAGVGVIRQVRQGERGVTMATEGHTTAGYIAEEPGGYLAAGTWRLTITRDGQVIELRSTTNDHCGRTGVIRPGDEVRGSIRGRGSTLRVGEKFTCPD